MGEWNGREIWVVLSVYKTNQGLWNSNKCFNQNAFLFSSNLIHKLHSFWIFLLSHFLFFLFFLRNFIPSFCFWFSFFLSLNNNKKIKLLQLSFRYNHRIPSIKDKKSLSKSCKHNVTMVMEFWSGGMNVCEVGEQRKTNDVYRSSGLFLEFNSHE